jgi:hypothetical protein
VDDAHVFAVARVSENGVGQQQGGGDVEVQRVGDGVVGLRAERGGGDDGAGVIKKPEGGGLLAGVAEGVAAGESEDGLRVGQIDCGFVQLAGVGGGKCGVRTAGEADDTYAMLQPGGGKGSAETVAVAGDEDGDFLHFWHSCW